MFSLTILGYSQVLREPGLFNYIGKLSNLELSMSAFPAYSISCSAKHKCSKFKEDSTVRKQNLFISKPSKVSVHRIQNELKPEDYPTYIYL